MVKEGDEVILITTETNSDNTYEWYKDGFVLPGSTTDTLRIASVGNADEGSYYVSITNSQVFTPEFNHSKCSSSYHDKFKAYRYNYRSNGIHDSRR